jgi:steroid delta-isomerase-like uncharacterized protein
MGIVGYDKSNVVNPSYALNHYVPRDDYQEITTMSTKEMSTEEMSTEENKALVHQIVEAVNQGNFAAGAELLAADYRDYSDPPGAPTGPEGAKQRWAMLRQAFPDGGVTIEDKIAEGDKVAVRFIFHGTHQGELMGIPPTGRQVSVSGMDINCIRGGRIAERWAVFDMLSLLQQLGVLPMPG